MKFLGLGNYVSLYLHIPKASKPHAPNKYRLDYSKAFDSVPHASLIEKLRVHIGLHNTDLLAWLTDYVTSRKQQVIVNGVSSDQVIATSGVS